MLLKMTQDRPTKGQFLHLYEYEGALWSTVCRWDSKELMSYCEATDEWVEADDFCSECNTLGYMTGALGL